MDKQAEASSQELRQDIDAAQTGSSCYNIALISGLTGGSRPKRFPQETSPEPLE